MNNVSYEVPTASRIRALILMRGPLIIILVAAGLLVHYFVRQGSLSNTIIVVIVFAFLVIASTESRRLVVGIEGTASGLEITTLGGRVVRRIGWAGIKELKCGSSRFRRSVKLTTQDGASYDLRLIPGQILDNLALVMREASNARIVGFDHE